MALLPFVSIAIGAFVSFQFPNGWRWWTFSRLGLFRRTGFTGFGRVVPHFNNAMANHLPVRRRRAPSISIFQLISCVCACYQLDSLPMQPPLPRRRRASFSHCCFLVTESSRPSFSSVAFFFTAAAFATTRRRRYRPCQ